MVGPFGGIGACLPQGPFADRQNEAGLFGDRNEHGRRDPALLGMMPPQQGLQTANLIALQIDHRLIVKFEFPVRERLAQVELQLAARLHVRIHDGFEEAVGAAAFSLGAMQRQVCILQ